MSLNLKIQIMSLARDLEEALAEARAKDALAEAAVKGPPKEPGIFVAKLDRVQQDIIGSFDDPSWMHQVGLTITPGPAGLYDFIRGNKRAMELLADAYEERADPDSGFDTGPMSRHTARVVGRRIRALIKKGA